MVKKTPPPAGSPFEAAAGVFDGALASTVKESAQQIWLAGLGAFAKAQEEGGRVFDALVQEGTTLQRKTQTLAEEKLGAASTQLSAQVAARLIEVGQKVDQVSAKATGQWDRLETIFEERVARALTQLGVPQSAEVRELSARVEQLSAQLAELAALNKAPRRAARAKPTARASARPDKPALKGRAPTR